MKLKQKDFPEEIGCWSLKTPKYSTKNLKLLSPEKYDQIRKELWSNLQSVLADKIKNSHVQPYRDFRRRCFS